ncbi:ribonuclease R [Kordiimonas aquimaris]|uniref:ribonuclease R n=1 Tax=Kordiimonas aquimaris TaxID=707591 RepID=UPI0021D09CA0|nr:ribonuclease R [Kordiimonas aquimaris]
MVNKNTLDHFPTKDDILGFLKDARSKATKREIARAFQIRGQDKVLLKKLLREMLNDGIIAQDASRSLRPAEQLSAVQVVEYAGVDTHGDVLVRPVKWDGSGPAPKIFLSSDKRKKGPAIGAGERALAKLIPIKNDPPVYRAQILKVLKPAPRGILGVFKGGENGGRIHPVDKKNRDEYWVDKEDVRGAVDGELVTAEPVLNRRRSSGPKRARVREALGDVSAARSISMIAIHAHDIPMDFPNDVLKSADQAKPVDLSNRDDLRSIPLITIDPVDARDHDDAIWAEPDSDPKNKDGWHAIVAIADVAHYVQSGSALDREAIKRGNSCYFPDRVVPMLPEALSAGLCSLQPGKDRACMAVHMWFDAYGNKIRHKFVRGLMNSHANINYAQAQAALDGLPDEMTEPLLKPVLAPLLGTFKALMAARDKREPLELDLPERKIELSKEGFVKGIVLRERLDTHRIVEEFMIAANVAAAEELERKRVPAMYRVHEEPPLDKLENLREFLSTLDMKLTKGAVMMPRLFNGILSKVRETAHEQMVNQVVLRSQTQAYYSPDNQGHFGLALPKYAHFTSPIRRYADLLVHRGLIKALGLGDDGLTAPEIEELNAIGEQISNTERRAMAAERESTDRYMAAYLADHVGDQFIGRITGVTRFGLFVELEPSGGDGLIPISEIGNDYYTHDEDHHRLVGERFGEEFKLGDKLDVRLTEANKFTGGLRLELIDDGTRPGHGQQKKYHQRKRAEQRNRGNRKRR